jgi:Chorismate mutase
MINEYRAEIDLIDQQSSVLFSRRIEISREIAEYEKNHKLPVIDIARQEQVLNQLTISSSAEILSNLRELYMTIFRLSHTLQEGGRL